MQRREAAGVTDDQHPARTLALNHAHPFGFHALGQFRLHVDKGLANGHAYTYGVAAVDAAGNMSPVASATATPKAPA